MYKQYFCISKTHLGHLAFGNSEINVDKTNKIISAIRMRRASGL